MTDDIYTAVGYNGQFIMVAPKEKIVAVFTSSLPFKAMYIPIGLLGAYILPAAKSPTPLPENPDVAKKIAEHGIIVTYPKVFLENNETFQCGGNVADNYFIFPNGRVYQRPICEDFALHSYEIINNELIPTPKINEKDLFNLK